MNIIQKIINSQSIRQSITFIFFGTMFGFLLSRSGATSHDFYAELFLFINYQLLTVIATATATAMVGVQIIKRFKLKTLMTQCPIKIESKKKLPWSYVGAVIFGMGWAISGSCPGTLPAMIGQGQLSSMIVFIGVFVGVWIYAKILKLIEKIEKINH